MRFRNRHFSYSSKTQPLSNRNSLLTEARGRNKPLNSGKPKVGSKVNIYINYPFSEIYRITTGTVIDVIAEFLVVEPNDKWSYSLSTSEKVPYMAYYVSGVPLEVVTQQFCALCSVKDKDEFIKRFSTINNPASKLKDREKENLKHVLLHLERPSSDQPVVKKLTKITGHDELLVTKWLNQSKIKTAALMDWYTYSVKNNVEYNTHDLYIREMTIDNILTTAIYSYFKKDANAATRLIKRAIKFGKSNGYTDPTLSNADVNVALNDDNLKVGDWFSYYDTKRYEIKRKKVTEKINVVGVDLYMINGVMEIFHPFGISVYDPLSYPSGEGQSYVIDKFMRSVKYAIEQSGEGTFRKTLLDFIEKTKERTVKEFTRK